MNSRETDLLFLLSSIEPDRAAIDLMVAEPVGIDWQSIFDNSRALSTTLLVYSNLKRFGLWNEIAVQDKDGFRKNMMKVAQDNVVELEHFKCITKELNDVGIVPMPLKGVAFSILGVYLHLGLRQSVDIDFLLDNNDMARAIDFFKKRGLEIKFDVHGRFGAVVNCFKDTLSLEAHYRLFFWIFEEMYYRNFTNDVLARSSIAEYDGCKIRLMCKEDLLLYLCLKCAFDEYRTFKYFVDIDAVARKYRSLIDWGVVYDRASSTHTEKTLTRIFSFLVNKMHTPLPLQTMKLSRKTFEISYFKSRRERWCEVLKLFLTESPSLKAALYIITYYALCLLHVKLGWFKKLFAQPVFVPVVDGTDVDKKHVGSDSA